MSSDNNQHSRQEGNSRWRLVRNTSSSYQESSNSNQQRPPSEREGAGASDSNNSFRTNVKNQISKLPGFTNFHTKESM